MATLVGMSVSHFDFDRLYSARISTEAPRGPRPKVPFDFAVGHPDPSAFPGRELGEATLRMLLREGPELALYPGDASHRAARELIARKLEEIEGIKVPISRITMTNGSLQGIQMIAESFVDPGDTIIIEEFTYVGALPEVKTSARVRGRGDATKDGAPGRAQHPASGVRRLSRSPVTTGRDC